MCYLPTRPELPPLDDSEHIGSEKNVRLLILNIADLAAYTELLEATIKCYMNKPNEAEPKTGMGNISPTRFLNLERSGARFGGKIIGTCLINARR